MKKVKSRTLGTKGSRVWDKNIFDSNQGPSTHSYDIPKRLNSGRMRGLKECFVCGQDHRSNYLEYVTEAIKKLKDENFTTQFSMEELSYILNSFSLDVKEESVGEADIAI